MPGTEQKKSSEIPLGTLYAVDRDGREYSLAGRERSSLMEMLKQGGLSLEALCGGSCLCATCHVYVDPPWLDKLLPPTEQESDTLEYEAEEVQSNSRLACQIQWHHGLAGIRLTVAPEI
jgi:2Fe-2S ferredoxin